MTVVPERPKVYHITLLRNLQRIIEEGVLWSDAKRIELGFDCDMVGMPHIKQRRLTEIEVNCHAGTFVGHYVPFYFCPRSIMLFILHKGNHPDLNYHEGQEPVVHLEADLRVVIEWCEEQKCRWAFSAHNAGARYTNFFTGLDNLGEVDWEAVRATVFQDRAIKEGKQAEFLVEESFPWELVERIGVLNNRVRKKVEAAITNASHQPEVLIKTDWYY